MSDATEITIDLTIDPAGRLVIPKTVRDRLGLTPGRRLRLVQRGDSIELTPVAVEADVINDRGVWRLAPRVPVTITENDVRRTTETLRAER
jgi:AbrB family looped-hinge helix DNA binding protein